VDDTGFATVPDAGRFVVGNARLPAVLLADAPPIDVSELLTADIVISGGVIEEITAPGAHVEMLRVDLADVLDGEN